MTSLATYPATPIKWGAARRTIPSHTFRAAAADDLREIAKGRRGGGSGRVGLPVGWGVPLLEEMQNASARWSGEPF
jgi:hypothetical protein